MFRKYWIIRNMPEEGIAIVNEYAKQEGLKIGYAVTKLVKIAKEKNNEETTNKRQS